MADRHALWRRVALDVERLHKSAPEGHVVVVLVFISGRTAPVEAGFVSTNRNPDYPYVRIETEGAAGVDDKAHPSARWIHVHESLIDRVEIAFKQAPEGYDFSRFRVTDELEE